MDLFLNLKIFYREIEVPTKRKKIAFLHSIRLFDLATLELENKPNCVSGRFTPAAAYAK